MTQCDDDTVSKNKKYTGADKETMGKAISITGAGLPVVTLKGIVKVSPKSSPKSQNTASPKLIASVGEILAAGAEIYLTGAPSVHTDAQDGRFSLGIPNEVFVGAGALSRDSISIYTLFSDAENHYGMPWQTVGPEFPSTLQGGFVAINLDCVNPLVSTINPASRTQADVHMFDGNAWLKLGNTGFTSATNSSLDFSNLVLACQNEVPYIAYMTLGSNGTSGVKMFDGSTWNVIGNLDFFSSNVDEIFG